MNKKNKNIKSQINSAHSIHEIIKEYDEIVRILTGIVKSAQKGKNYGKE
jgi:hypothetical protein